MLINGFKDSLEEAWNIFTVQGNKIACLKTLRMSRKMSHWNLIFSLQTFVHFRKGRRNAIRLRPPIEVFSLCTRTLKKSRADGPEGFLSASGMSQMEDPIRVRSFAVTFLYVTLLFNKFRQYRNSMVMSTL